MIKEQEDAIIARLDGAIPGARAKAFPAKPSEYRFRGRGTEILVAYRGARPLGAVPIDGVGQARTQHWDLHILTRNLREHDGAYMFLEAVQARLFNWTCPLAAAPMMPAADDFVSETDGVWTYIARYTQQVVIVATPDPEPLPLLERIDTVDDDGEITTTEVPAP